MGRASSGHERKASTHQPEASRCQRRRHGKLLPEHPGGAKQTRQLPQTSLAEAGNLTRRALSERPRNASPERLTAVQALAGPGLRTSAGWRGKAATGSRPRAASGHEGPVRMAALVVAANQLLEP